MIVAIHAYEGIFGGLHGIEDYLVTEVKELKAAEDIASDLAYSVVEDYSYNFDEEDLDDPELCWEIYEVTNTKDKDENELTHEYWNDPDTFIEDYGCIQLV